MISLMFHCLSAIILIHIVVDGAAVAPTASCLNPLPAMEYHGNKFYMTAGSLAFASGNQECLNLGLQFARINTDIDYEGVVAFMTSISKEEAWVNLHNPNQKTCSGAESCNNLLYEADGTSPVDLTGLTKNTQLEVNSEKTCIYFAKDGFPATRDCAKAREIICELNCGAEWGPWSNWSECPVTCGDGVVKRNRTCFDVDKGTPLPDSNCTFAGNSTHVIPCNTTTCPASCLNPLPGMEYHGNKFYLTAGSLAFASGNQECLDLGLQFARVNTDIDYEGVVAYMTSKNKEEAWVNLHNPNQKTCSGAESCNNLLYEADGTSPVDLTGLTKNTQLEVDSKDTCIYFAKDGFPATRDCTKAREIICELDCAAEWGDWKSWSSCSRTCGGANITRTRKCLYRDGVTTVNDTWCASSGGSSMDVQPCATNLCPVWGDWGNWTTCSLSCGGGNRTRERTCTNGTDLDPSLCDGGNSIEAEICNSLVCPTWGNWSNWTACSQSCGDGSRVRDRTCTNGTDLNPSLCGGGDPREVEGCNLGVCPAWSVWTPWTNCPVSCGGATQSKTRNCTNGSDLFSPSSCGGGDEFQSQSCGTSPCPIHGGWSNFGPWSNCSSTSQYRIRTRACDSPVPEFGGLTCPGLALEKHSTPCPGHTTATWSEWSAWSDCSTTCRHEMTVRRRSCNWIGACDGLGKEANYCQITNCTNADPYTTSQKRAFAHKVGSALADGFLSNSSSFDMKSYSQSGTSFCLAVCMKEIRSSMTSHAHPLCNAFALEANKCHFGYLEPMYILEHSEMGSSPIYLLSEISDLLN